MGVSTVLMQKSLPLFLRQLHLCRKSFRELDILKVLFEDDFEELKNLGLLKPCSDATHVMCESCDDPHPTSVRYDGKKPYTLCIRDSMPRYLESNEIRKWEFDVRTFLQGMTVKLGINEEIEPLEVDGLWYLGTFTKDDIPHSCYFYHGKKLENATDLIESQQIGFGRQIVITSKKTALAKPKERNVFPLDAGLLAALKAGEVKFNKKVFHQYLNAFRGVQFDVDSGDLRVNGELIVNIPLKTAQYHFAVFLWEDFGKSRANLKIREYVCKKRRYTYDRSPDQFSYDMKNKIRSKVKKDERKYNLLDTIFVPSGTQDNQNGFKMQNPTL